MPAFRSCQWCDDPRAGSFHHEAVSVGHEMDGGAWSAGVGAERGGDVGAALAPEEGEDEVAASGHDLGRPWGLSIRHASSCRHDSVTWAPVMIVRPSAAPPDLPAPSTRGCPKTLVFGTIEPEYLRTLP